MMVDRWVLAGFSIVTLTENVPMDGFSIEAEAEACQREGETVGWIIASVSVEQDGARLQPALHGIHGES